MIINVDSDPNCTSLLRQIIKHTLSRILLHKNQKIVLASDNHDQQKETSYNNKYFQKKAITKKRGGKKAHPTTHGHSYFIKS
jgi:hypothetical protein